MKTPLGGICWPSPEKLPTRGEQFCSPRGDLGPLVATRRGTHLVLLAGPRNASAPSGGEACDEDLAWTARHASALAR